jgi:hypothetical protein
MELSTDVARAPAAPRSGAAVIQERFNSATDQLA